MLVYTLGQLAAVFGFGVIFGMVLVVTIQCWRWNRAWKKDRAELKIIRAGRTEAPIAAHSWFKRT